MHWVAKDALGAPEQKEHIMPKHFTGGLDGQDRQKNIDILQGTLTDTIALTLAVKQAHWTLKGPGFIGVHELLDVVADNLRNGADLMAERITIMGGFPAGTVEAVADSTALKAYPVELEAIEDHVAALTERMEAVAAKIRTGMNDATDEDTADLLTEVSRQLEKDTWFIGANRAPT